MIELKWLKDCEICNTGLCNQMTDYINAGMSTRQAAKQMEHDCRSDKCC